MHKLWFKRKKYGYGWTPATREGWIVITVYLGILLVDIYRINQFALSGIEFLAHFLPDMFFLTLLMLVISLSTGEKPGWQWGDKSRNRDKN